VALADERRRLRTNVRFRIETTGPACLVSGMCLV
jgi:hypothetical protein